MNLPSDGQISIIRIITDEWLPSPHRCYRYKYEVIDEESPYHERVDMAHSDVPLSAGHTYVVRFNTDPQDPRIEESVEEIGDEASRPPTGSPTPPSAR